MRKIQLVYDSMASVMGADDISLIVLTDLLKERQITVVCDAAIQEQILMRVDSKNREANQLLLPEVLVRNFMAYELDNYELDILSVNDGVYRTVLLDNNTSSMTPIRLSDGVLLSIISGLKIFISEELMNRQSAPYTDLQDGQMPLPINTLNVKMLRQALQKAIDAEDYEMASYIRDEMKRRKDGQQ